MDPALIAAVLFASLSGALVGLYVLRKYWPSEARLREAEALVEEHKRRVRIAAQWPAIRAAVAQHESEIARLASRVPDRDLMRLLRDEHGAEIPVPIARTVVADDFGGGPSVRTGPHHKIGDGQ